MSAGVWYGKRTWLGRGFALVLALALDALGALLLARGMVPMAAARAWTLGSWAAGGFCGTRMASRSWTTTYSACPPPPTIPITRFPGAHRPAPSPTASTSPAYSSPGMSAGAPGGAG